MSNHIVELNGDSIAIVINREPGPDGQPGCQVKIVPGPVCTYNPQEVAQVVIAALTEFVNGGGEFIES